MPNPRQNRTAAADAAQTPTPTFVAETEYIFSLRSFRMKNGFAFATVMYKDIKVEILIGSTADYKFGDLLIAKQGGGNLYATFKQMAIINGEEYPRFWNIGIG